MYYCNSVVPSVLEVHNMLLGKKVCNWGFLESIFEAIFTKNGKHVAVLILFNCFMTVLFFFFCGLFPLHSWDVHWHPSLLFRRWSVEYCKTLVWWQVIWSKCIALQWICQDCSDTISINIDALSSGVPLILLRLVTYMLHQRFQYYLSFMLQGFWNTLSIVCCSKQNTMFWYINLFLFWGSKLMR